MRERFDDEACLTGRESLIKSGQWPTYVTWSVRVCQTKRDVVQTALSHEVLPGGLGDRIAAIARVEGLIKGNWLLLRAEPVAQCRLVIDETADPGVDRSSDDVGGAQDVRSTVLGPCLRIFVRRRCVYDHLRPESREDSFDHATIRDSALHQFKVW